MESGFSIVRGPAVAVFSAEGPALSTGAALTPRYQQMIALPWLIGETLIRDFDKGAYCPCDVPEI
jgi:hypothetical protein